MTTILTQGDFYGNYVTNKVIEYKDQNNNKFQYAFDIFGNLLQYSVYDNNTTKWKVLRQMTYDSNSNKTKEMDAYGHSTQYSYDSANRLIGKSFWPDNNTKTKSMKLQYTIAYDANTPLLLTTTDEDGYIKKYHYDTLNQLIKMEVNPYKLYFFSTDYTYDYVGHKTSESEPIGAGTVTNTYTYDDLGRLSSLADARSHTTNYYYDAGNNLIEQKNPLLKSTYYEYDTLGRLVRKKEPTAADTATLAITRYIYDAAGNKLKEISPNYYDQSKDTTALASAMTGTSYTYNAMNRLESTRSPEGVILEYRTYDANGNVQKVIDGLRYNGNITTSPGTTYQYDAFNRKTNETNAFGNAKTYTYTLTGELASSRDANGYTTNYDYYPDGTLLQIRYPDGGRITYTYDNRKYKASETQYTTASIAYTTNYEYNGFGKISKITDPKLNTIVYTYYNNGVLYAVKDKNGHYTYYIYYSDHDLQKKKIDLDASHYAAENYITDACGNVTTKTLSGNVDTSSSRVTTYSYYDNNLLKTATDTSPNYAGNPNYNSGSYFKNYYDLNNNLVKVETKRDNANTDVVKYVYDNRNHKIKDIRLVDESSVYNAASLPNIANLRDPIYSGKVQLITGYAYDLIGNLTSVVDPRAYGYLDSDTTNRNKYTTYNAYDNQNRLVTITKMVKGTNVTTKYYYDAVGNKKVVQNERGYYKVYTYDGMNRLKTVTDPETDPALKSTLTNDQISNLAGQATNTLQKTKIYGYDLAGNNTSITDANGNLTNYAYNSLNRLQTTYTPYNPSQPNSQTNPYALVVEERVYDANGNLTKKIDAKGYQSGSDDTARYGTEYTYDYTNNLLTVLDPEGKSNGLTFTTKYQYNQYGEKTQTTDALNNNTKFDYNSAGKLVKVTDPRTVATNYTFDNAGNMLSMINGKQKVTGYAYGSCGLLLNVTDANNKTTSYKYDLAGNTADMTDRNGKETIMTYDARNLLLTKSVPATGDSITFTYDNVGNRENMTDSATAVVSSYTYDANNQLSNIKNGTTIQIGYIYDKSGNILTITDSKGFVTTYTYDQANRMASISYTINGTQKTTSYSYDVNGNRQSISYPGNITESYQFDKNNRLASLTNTSSIGTVSSYTYTYYNNGLQYTKQDSYGITTYTYDADNRIQEIDAPGKTTVYNYDDAGNRLSMDETYTSAQSSGYTGQNGIVTYLVKHSDYVYSDTNALLQLSESMQNPAETEVLKKISNYKYDNNGNQLSQQSEYLVSSGASGSPSYNGINYGNTSTTFDSSLERTENSYDGFNRLAKVDVIKAPLCQNSCHGAPMII